MPEVVVLGTVAADIVVRVAALPRAGEQVGARSTGWRLGGSSANLACGLALAGRGVELIGPVGDDPIADALLVELRRLGVRTDRTIRTPAPAPRALILLDDAGERAILQLDGEFADRAFPVTRLPNLDSARCVYVESYRRFEVDVASACPDALIVATPPVAGALTWPADMLVGSASQYPPEWLSSPFEHARAVAGPRLHWVVVTRGADGADAFGPDGALHVAAQPADQVDATGAGDAFLAGVLCGLLAGRGMREAMELGAEHGAAAVEVRQSIPPGLADCLG